MIFFNQLWLTDSVDDGVCIVDAPCTNDRAWRRKWPKSLWHVTHNLIITCQLNRKIRCFHSFIWYIYLKELLWVPIRFVVIINLIFVVKCGHRSRFLCYRSNYREQISNNAHGSQAIQRLNKCINISTQKLYLQAF